MNKIKAIFTNRKFSLDGLIEAICTIVAFVVLFVAIIGFGWLASTYPAETAAAIACIVTVALICWILAGIFDTIFPKNNDLEIDKWVENAKKELEKLRTEENIKKHDERMQPRQKASGMMKTGPCDGFDEEGFPMKNSPWAVHHEECDSCRQTCPLDVNPNSP